MRFFSIFSLACIAVIGAFSSYTSATPRFDRPEIVFELPHAPPIQAIAIPDVDPVIVHQRFKNVEFRHAIDAGNYIGRIVDAADPIDPGRRAH